MTDISVIKMIISVAVWRIYPSWVNDKLWAWEGLGHSGMFGARLSRDDFRSKLENISFLFRVMSVSKSFLFPALLKNLAPNIQALGFWFRWCLGGLFENSAPSPGMFLRTPTTTTIIFWEFPFVFPKQSRCYLQADSYGDPQAEQSTLVMVRWKLEWNLTSGRWRDRAQKDHRSLSRLVPVVCGDPWSKREKNTTKSACDCAKAQPFIIYKPASFEEPVSETRCRYRFRTSLFSWSWMYSCRTVRLQRGESEEKQSSMTLPVLITEA